MNKIQLVQLKILKEFILVTSKLNLKYYALGGTVLGAVRHMGFIPWDDDIDVGLPREDYNIFLKKAPKLLSNEYFLQTYHTEKYYNNNYAKIRDNNTVYIEKKTKHLNINHGISIDIFPIDGYHNNKIIGYIKYNIIKMMINKIKINTNIYKVSDSALVNIKKLFIKLLYNKYSNYELNIMIDHICTQSLYYNSNFVINFFGAWGLKELIPKYYFGKGKLLKFEDIEIKVPEKYDLYLKSLYNDYMKLPPEEFRIGHHPAEIILYDKKMT